MRLRGADSARRVVKFENLSMGNLFLPFSDEVHYGERVGLIGPNGTGKSHLLGALVVALAIAAAATSLVWRDIVSWLRATLGLTFRGSTELRRAF